MGKSNCNQGSPYYGSKDPGNKNEDSKTPEGWSFPKTFDFINNETSNIIGEVKALDDEVQSEVDYFAPVELEPTPEKKEENPNRDRRKRSRNRRRKPKPKPD